MRTVSSSSSVHGPFLMSSSIVVVCLVFSFSLSPLSPLSRSAAFSALSSNKQSLGISNVTALEAPGDSCDNAATDGASGAHDAVVSGVEGAATYDDDDEEEVIVNEGTLTGVGGLVPPSTSSMSSPEGDETWQSW